MLIGRSDGGKLHILSEMDPASALGAAGSIVGIAGFGLQLSNVLYQYISQAKSANYSLRAILEGINATTGAMNQVHGLIDDEKESIEGGGKPILFSYKALGDVKKTADQCLILFWRIEATITKTDDSKCLEKKLERELHIFNENINAKTDSRLRKLDSVLVLSKLECLRWPFIAPKLDDYNQQLQRLQMNLILIFQVVSIRALSRRT